MSDHRERSRSNRPPGVKGPRKVRAAAPGGSRARHGVRKSPVSPGRSRGRQRARKGGAKPGRSKLPQAVVKQAKAMVAQSGIPFHAAVKVVQGKTTLNEVLQALLREEKIKKLMETYAINRALATNVALGRTNLEIVLLRRRKNQTLQKYFHRSCLEESLQSGARIALGVHGHTKVLGRVIENNKYTILFQPDSGGDPVELHKTRIKFAYDPTQYKLLKKHLKIDKKVKALNLEPIINPRNRYHFKNLVLQQAMDEHREVQVVTLEGDTFKGHVEWFGRWEFGLKFKGGVRATLFRHAVYRLALLDR